MALTKTPIELSSTPSIVDGGNATAITIDSSENVLVGKTVSNDNVSGTQIYGGANAGIVSSTFAGRPLYLNRLTTDGDIIDFAKDGAAVGSIGTPFTGELYIAASGANSSGLLLTESNAVRPMKNGSASDATQDLGRINGRWKDLYLSGGAYLGGTAAANKLDDYEEGTWTMGIVRSSAATLFMNNTTGRYTKVGNLVTVSVYTEAINVSAAGGGTTDITGLPFTVAAGPQSYSAASFAHTDLFSTTYEAYAAINTTFARVTQVGSISNAGLSLGFPKYMMFSLTYSTDA